MRYIHLIAIKNILFSKKHKNDDILNWLRLGLFI